MTDVRSSTHTMHIQEHNILLFKPVVNSYRFHSAWNRYISSCCHGNVLWQGVQVGSYTPLEGHEAPDAYHIGAGGKVDCCVAEGGREGGRKEENGRGKPNDTHKSSRLQTTSTSCGHLHYWPLSKLLCHLLKQESANHSLLGSIFLISENYGWPLDHSLPKLLITWLQW